MTHMRRPRFKLSPSESSAVYHCISRIVAGEFLLSTAPIKETLRRMMRRQAAFCGVQIITYSLMSNHFHILTRVPIQPELTDLELLKRVEIFYGKDAPESLRLNESMALGGSIREQERIRFLKRMYDVSVFMKELKQRFTVWYNKRTDRFGTLWAERFRSILVEDRADVVRTVAAYIDLNPVRAGMVEDPANYRFCGYAEAAAGQSMAIAGIESFVGTAEGDWRRVVGKYRETLFSKAGSGETNDDLELEKIRKLWKAKGKLSATQAIRLRIRYFNDGAALGSQLFVEEIFQRFRHRFGPKRRTGARTLRRMPFPELRTLRALRVSPVE
jgi:putative transposase